MKRRATFTYEDGEAGPLYYFTPESRSPGPYRQRQVRAVVDIADDGTLAGVELIDFMPPLRTSDDHS